MKEYLQVEYGKAVCRMSDSRRDKGKGVGNRDDGYSRPKEYNKKSYGQITKRSYEPTTKKSYGPTTKKSYEPTTKKSYGPTTKISYERTTKRSYGHGQTTTKRSYGPTTKRSYGPTTTTRLSYRIGQDYGASRYGASKYGKRRYGGSSSYKVTTVKNYATKKYGDGR